MKKIWPSEVSELSLKFKQFRKSSLKIKMGPNWPGWENSRLRHPGRLGCRPGLARSTGLSPGPEPGRTQPNLAGLFYVGRFSEVCFVIRARWQALIGLSFE